MGLFDFFKKLAGTPEIIGGDSSDNTKNINKIPSKYRKFPIYNGEIIGRPTEEKKYAYDRLTMYVKVPLDETFLTTMREAGFEQATKVRYDKGHTYIIIETISTKRIKIAYHIKK